MAATINILNNIIVLMLDISLWSARKKLKPEDLKGVNLPPDKLASLGSKRVYDPEALTVFATLKRKAERACLADGTRFLGGFAIPSGKLSALLVELEGIEKEFLKAKQEFLKDYEKNLNEWIAEAGEWADIIEAAVESCAAVDGKLSFGYTPYKVAPAFDDTEMSDDSEAPEKAGQLLGNQINGLAGQLLKEIGQVAKDSFLTSFQGKVEVTRKALRPLDFIREKLEGLSFVAPHMIMGLLGNIDAALATVPKSGPITGAPFMAIVGVLSELSNINSFIAAKAQAPDMEAEDEDMAEITVATKPPTPKPVSKPRSRKMQQPALPIEMEVSATPPTDSDQQIDDEAPGIPEVIVIPEPEAQAPESWFW